MQKAYLLIRLLTLFSKEWKPDTDLGMDMQRELDKILSIDMLVGFPTWQEIIYKLCK